MKVLYESVYNLKVEIMLTINQQTLDLELTSAY